MIPGLVPALARSAQAMGTRDQPPFDLVLEHFNDPVYLVEAAREGLESLESTDPFTRRPAVQETRCHSKPTAVQHWRNRQPLQAFARVPVAVATRRSY